MSQSVIDAAFHLVHDYPGGAASLGPRVKKPSTTLCHEVSETGTAKLGLKDALKLSLVSGNLSILHAFAAACGQVCLPMPDLLVEDGSDLLASLSRVSADFGDLVRETIDDAGDKVLTDTELARIERKRMELIARLHRFGEAAVALNQAGKPMAFRRSAE